MLCIEPLITPRISLSEMRKTIEAVVIPSNVVPNIMKTETMYAKGVVGSVTNMNNTIAVKRTKYDVGIVIVGLTLSEKIPRRGMPKTPNTTEMIMTFA